mmetsp:Transcript_16541/g.28923  ORF Transcript_16541/g.28923 Transcript_16541/m.28923 type:complete len:178 (+) Transcript_16541:34-567(+)
MSVSVAVAWWLCIGVALSVRQASDQIEAAVDTDNASSQWHGSEADAFLNYNAREPAGYHGGYGQGYNQGPDTRGSDAGAFLNYNAGGPAGQHQGYGQSYNQGLDTRGSDADAFLKYNARPGYGGQRPPPAPPPRPRCAATGASCTVFLSEFTRPEERCCPGTRCGCVDQDLTYCTCS